MSKTNLVLLWILAFLGFVFDLLTGSKTFVRYGFIGFNLLLLLAVGFQSIFKDSKRIKFALIWITLLLFLSSLVILVLGFIFKIDSFGLGLIVYALFTLSIASGLTTLVFLLVQPIITKKENIGRRDILVFLYILMFLLTHMLTVPKNVDVPLLTYFISIVVVCFLLVVLKYLAYKILKLSNQYFLSFIILLLIVISHLSFAIQVILLLPLQVFTIVLLAYNIVNSPKVKEAIYKKNNVLGVDVNDN